MLENLKVLSNEFYKIKKMGYVKSNRRGVTGIGKTFEDLLNKREDKLSFPDYRGIEIKTKLAYSKSYTALFNKSPDGFMITQKLCQKYGYPDKVCKTKKILNVSINSNLTLVSRRYSFNLKVDENKEKIFLIIKDLKGNLLDDTICWSFEVLKNILYTKLKYMAIVYAWPTKRNKETYYKYYQIKFFELIEFKAFLNLIKKGLICVNIKVGLYKNGPRKGQYHDHGTSFELKDTNFPLLFNRIYI